MKIQELMTSEVRACRPEDNLSAAAQAMWEGDLGCLPVVDGEHKLVGVITDRDICMAAHLRGAPLWTLPVAETMAKNVFSCGPADKPADVLELCAEKRIRRVPVVDGEGLLIGMVTLSGLAHAVEGDGKARPGVSAKDVCRTLSAVTSRRPQAVGARMEIEVTRQSLEAKGTLFPTPRGESRKSTARDKKPRKSRSSKS